MGPAQGAALGTQAPTILNGPGLGLPGETNPTALDNPLLPNQVIGMAPLLHDGYNVVTDVLSLKELEDIAANYKRVAGFQVEGLNAKPPIVTVPARNKTSNSG